MGGWNWIDKTNMRWGKLVAIKYLGNKKWLCHCDCGNDTVVYSSCLKMNRAKRSTMSCGCGLIGMNKDINYFENIDTEEKAYILGFIAADGTIENNEEKSNFSVKITVNSIDIDILEKMKKEFKTEATIKTKKVRTNLPQGGICDSTMSSLLICSKKIVNDLDKYGITPHKSLTLNVNFDLIPKELHKHFLRGLFDGDGTFGMYDRKVRFQYVVSLVSSIYMVKKVKNVVQEEFPNFKINIWKAKNCNENIYRWGLSRKLDFKTFLDWLYKDSNIYLKRKYDKYLDCIERYNKTKQRKPPKTNYNK